MAIPLIRRPAVAGYFYPADAAALRDQVDALTRTSEARAAARAVIVPHGSYRHAGSVIGATLGRVTVPRRCIVLGPSHTGALTGWSVMAGGAYRTPLGDVPVDEACAAALCARCRFLAPDAWAHRGEHAIEVLIPFLQRLGPADLTVTPIIVGSEDGGELRPFAQALAQVIRMQEEDVLLIGSSDLSHYETKARGAIHDRALSQALCTLDSGALARYLEASGVVMCGYGAAVCVLEAAKGLGAREASLAAYSTNADAGGDPDSVIGYAGFVINGISLMTQKPLQAAASR